MQKIYRLALLFCTIFLMGHALNAQTKYNFSQLNFNALPINPAYAGNTGATSFQASYIGVIGGAGTGLPRLFNFTLHSPTQKNTDLGIGGAFEVYRLGTLTNLRLKPSIAYQFDLGENQRLAIGGQIGMEYYDFGNSNNNPFVDVPQDLFTIGGGLGVFYYHNRFFAGLSAPILAQAEINQVNENYPSIVGEHPIYLHTGYWFDFLPLVKIKTAALVNRTTFFEFPVSIERELDTKTEFAAKVDAIFDDRYWFGIGYGRVNNDEGTADYNYLNFSAVYTFNLARVSYTYQQILSSQFNLASNTRNVILLEFDLIDGGEERVIRYY